MALTLSRDLLQAVLELILTGDLCRLYMTGNRAFTALLDRASPAQMIFECRTRYMYGKWPVMASAAANLIHLELRTNSPLAEFPKVTQRHLKSLSVHLKTLILATPEAEQILIEDDPNELAELSQLYRSSFPDADASCPPRMVNLAKFFPHLETFAIESQERLFCDSDLCALPTGLLSLRLLSHSYTEDVFDFLPPTLSELRIMSVASASRFEKQDGAKPFFPPALKSFTWRISKLLPIASFSVAMASHLPKTLLELVIIPPSGSRISASRLAYMPDSLELINTGRNWEPMEFDDVATPLPTSLKSVNFSIDSAHHMARLPRYLPPKITLLRLTDMSGSTDFPWASLPRTLLSLELFVNAELPNLTQPILPPSLTVYSQHTQTYSLAGYWPETLTYLGLYGDAHADDFDAPGRLPAALKTLSTSVLTSSDLKRLPIGLTQLDCEDSLESINFSNHLPNLANLACYYLLSLEIQDINYLPKSLVSLMVNVTPNRELGWDMSQIVWPEHLTLIDLPLVTGSLSEAIIASFPRSLTHLHMDLVLAAPMLIELPRGLKVLNIKSIIVKPGQDLLGLPPRLESLVVTYGLFSAQNLSELPRTLSNLHHATRRFTAEDVKLLPIRLTFLSCDALDRSIEVWKNYQGPYDPVTRAKPQPQQPLLQRLLSNVLS